MLAGDVPALVSLDYAVAQGMPFPVPPLPPYLAHIYTRPPPSLPQGSGVLRALERVLHPRGSVGAAELQREVEEREMEGEVVSEESDVYGLGLTVRESLPNASKAFGPLLDVMLERQRHERITHVQSLRLLLGSLIEDRADLRFLAMENKSSCLEALSI